ncbi:unnamed protein product [Ceutorhynchus assimilis]|uniref:peptidylprolyl isomerase n=1 Tax=Ceutorhynchus assimilis TaxID=467358 RepID=A0A9P0GJQ3_9CUCU|nr:unnamed protein product [Ceutorhynchus assimilis]
MAEIDISPNNDGGVLKQILNEGTGTALPPPGCKVKVHYTGTLLDGTEFDSSRGRNDPFQFNLGKGNVIKGWDIGVATMKKGERAILTCASEYAYGESGSPPKIPPNSTLKFDVEVLDWRGEDLSLLQDGGIERAEILVSGTGFSTPNDGALVTAHLIGTYNGNVFDKRTVTFNLGEGSDQNVIEGIEIALQHFKTSESSRLIIQPKYAFGQTGSTEFNIPASAVVEYVVTLNSFEKEKESWAMDSQEKIEACQVFKEKGTGYFKKCKYDLAVKSYKKILSFLESDSDSGDERRSLLLAAHLNIALCYLKLNDNFQAKASATKALEIDPANEKALFRRGQALNGLGEPRLAAKDFGECLKLDPNNSAARAQQSLCSHVMKEQLEKEKKIYANMFDKFAKMDTQVVISLMAVVVLGNPDADVQLHQRLKRGFHKIVTVPKPYPVYIPKPYPVVKTIPIKVPYKVTVSKPYPVEVLKPYPVPVTKTVQVPVTRTVAVPVKVPIHVPYAVKVPYAVPKPYPIEIENLKVVKESYPVYIENKVPYPVVIDSGHHHGGYHGW